MKKALITGVAGQDGTYLAEFLLQKGYQVHGVVACLENSDYLRHRQFLQGVILHILDVTHSDGVQELVANQQFDEIYNLASQSSPSRSFDQPLQTFTVNTDSVIYFLEAIRRNSPHTRFYQASSSEIFGGIAEYAPQDEMTRLHPRSPYGVSKLASHWLVINYREAYGLKCCAGILFNHESPRRQGHFVTRKICDWVKLYRKGKHLGCLNLGNINVKRDWGHSRDFVRAMWMMLNPDSLAPPYRQEKPVFREYVVGMGKSYTIKDFIEKALAQVAKNIHWRAAGSIETKVDQRVFNIELEEGVSESNEVLVRVSPEFWRPAEVIEARSNSELIRRTLGWYPELDLNDIIKEMLES